MTDNTPRRSLDDLTGITKLVPHARTPGHVALAAHFVGLHSLLAALGVRHCRYPFKPGMARLIPGTKETRTDPARRRKS